ncbi:hypothetical protein Y032_0071g609 [Ancylostoma ceylanicum]|uniref:Uncharacterized protein n=1 Tax=Ancylostoma ceylanicum TaxID=53326 RepID=A0A016TYB5_9BILA|nr:hypothetical protein Y032_0071g609 [Ancylostoma ceylanicum]
MQPLIQKLVKPTTNSWAVMKQRETFRKKRKEGAVSHASPARTSFPPRVCARIVTNSRGWCAFHALHCTIFFVHS